MNQLNLSPNSIESKNLSKMLIAPNNQANDQNVGIELGMAMPEDRKESVIKIVQAMSLKTCLTKLPEIIRHNLIEHAKRIEQCIYADSATEDEYNQRLAEKMENICADLEEKIKKLPQGLVRNRILEARIPTANSQTNSQEWQRFYSSEVRNAVVIAFVEEVRLNIQVPMTFTLGLSLGAKAMEEIAFKRADSKIEYLQMLERRKAQITSELVAYFKSGNDD